MAHIWKCGFCNEIHTKLNMMRRHEGKCPSNPENKLCFSCNNYIPGVKTCYGYISSYNVYTSGIPCNKWTKKVEADE